MAVEAVVAAAVADPKTMSQLVVFLFLVATRLAPSLRSALPWRLVGEYVNFVITVYIQCTSTRYQV